MPIISSETAVKELMLHHVVALPTETVYGLAGMINSDVSLKAIFTTKARPFFDPLIVHVENLAGAESLAYWDQVSRELAHEFWPGPLTIVLPRRELVSDLITNGGPTVALRSPSHPVFRAVIEKLPCALAAPSANMFGKTSPTRAEHVIEGFNDQVNVVEGGECEHGIESTIVEYQVSQKKLLILRSGMIGTEQLESFLKKIDSNIEVQKQQTTHVPGHLKNHYQPDCDFFLVRNCDEDILPPDLVQELTSRAGHPVVQWRLDKDPRLAARWLYRDLREFSKQKQPCYFILSAELEKQDLWQGLVDRLEKACHHQVDWNQGQWLVNSKT